MEPTQLYNQTATHFTLRIFISPDAEVEGQLVLELADLFMSDLLFPGVRVTSLHTKRAGEGAKVNLGEFSERRWKTTSKKFRNNEMAALTLMAETPHFPNQKISLSIHVNPPGGDELLNAEQVEVMCSVPYLRHLAASPAKIEALLRLATAAWNRVSRPAYGYGNIAISPHRPKFPEWSLHPVKELPWEMIKAPAERAHAIPVAYVGDIDLNLQQAYVKGKGIKGAFWANFLAADHVAMAGGESTLRTRLPDMRIERLEHGGLLLVATDSPLPEDTDENHRRFLDLEAALKPAFLAKESTPENMRKYLGYFYRERP
jgi:hypothetical protein